LFDQPQLAATGPARQKLNPPISVMARVARLRCRPIAPTRTDSRSQKLAGRGTADALGVNTAFHDTAPCNQVCDGMAKMLRVTLPGSTMSNDSSPSLMRAPSVLVLRVILKLRLMSRSTKVLAVPMSVTRTVSLPVTSSGISVDEVSLPPLM